MVSNQNEIDELAYSLWEARGRPHGSSDEDWHAAERQLKDKSKPTASSTSKVDEASKESFPASDPPGSHLPDKPPSNADAKWAASSAAKSNNKVDGKSGRENR